jgi:cytidine deaminase
MTDLNPSVNWEELRLAAVEARKNSYSPYSKFPVGAAALTTDGRLVAGCNIENASFGMTLCAECSLISDLFRQGGGKLAYFACVDGEGNILMPCGRCRQLLFEHSAPGMQLLTVSGVKDITDVLPDAFGPAQLKEHKHD